MQIHELNGYTGALDDAYMAVDNGSDTGKEKIKDITDPLNARIDNIIAGPASSAQEVIDARLGADGITYPSLGDAIREQVTDIESDIGHVSHYMKKPESINLLDIDNVLYKTIMWANGTSQASDNFFVTNLIPVNEGEILNSWYWYQPWSRYYDSEFRTVTAYDSTMNVITASGSDSSVQDYTVPNGVAFVRCSIAIGAYDKQPMVTNTKLPVFRFEPYSKYYVEGGNFNPYDDSMEKVESINLKKWIFDNHYLGNTDIVPSDSNNYHIVNPIEIEEGESISCWQYQNGVITADGWRFLTAFDEHGNLLSSQGSTGGSNVYTAGVGSGVRYVYISQYKRGTPQIIVRGSSAPTYYEEYHEPYNVTTKAFEKDTYPYRTLLLGDSYNAQNLWVTSMCQEFRNMNVVNLGVISATIKDAYNNRAAYPYTSRPVSTNTSGNLNTVACQIEKLKRLMAGTDLDPGETAIYQTADEYPNVIIIEGGQNDQYDSDAKVETYYSQFLTLAQNVYYVHNNTTQQGDYYIASDLETIDRTCFAGAYRYITQTLHNMFPDAQIFFVTRSRLGYFVYDVNKRADKIAEQQRLCATLCGVSVIDWNKEGNISTVTDYPTGSGTSADPYKTQNTLDTSDGLHPNIRGGRWYGRLAAKVIKERFADIAQTL